MREVEEEVGGRVVEEDVLAIEVDATLVVVLRDVVEVLVARKVELCVVGARVVVDVVLRGREEVERVEEVVEREEVVEAGATEVLVLVEYVATPLPVLVDVVEVVVGSSQTRLSLSVHVPNAESDVSFGPQLAEEQ